MRETEQSAESAVAKPIKGGDIQETRGRPIPDGGTPDGVRGDGDRPRTGRDHDRNLVLGSPTSSTSVVSRHSMTQSTDYKGKYQGGVPSDTAGARRERR
jgi:hypothetical protein